MKIGEATKYYSDYLYKLQQKRQQLIQQKKEHEEQLQPNQKPNFDKLELQIKEIDEDSEKIRDFMRQLTERKMLMEDAKNNKERMKAEEEKMKEELKCFEIFRRIANGDRVPPFDEKKLMEYNPDMYQAAKNLASMRRNAKPKEYDSLWEDEEKKESVEIEIEDRDVPVALPELSGVDVSTDVETKTE